MVHSVQPISCTLTPRWWLSPSVVLKLILKSFTMVYRRSLFEADKSSGKLNTPHVKLDSGPKVGLITYWCSFWTPTQVHFHKKQLYLYTLYYYQYHGPRAYSLRMRVYDTMTTYYGNYQTSVSSCNKDWKFIIVSKCKCRQKWISLVSGVRTVTTEAAVHASVL